MLTKISLVATGAGVWFFFALVAMFWPRHRAAAVRVLLVLGVTLGVNDQILKPLVHRPRPFHDAQLAARVIQVPPPVTLSFPSGHSATAMAGAIALTRVWPAGGWLFWPLAATVGFSRIYVGVHYPSDVVGGALLGFACAWFLLAGRHPSTWSRRAASAPDVVHVP